MHFVGILMRHRKVSPSLLVSGEPHVGFFLSCSYIACSRRGLVYNRLALKVFINSQDDKLPTVQLSCLASDEREEGLRPCVAFVAV